MGRSRVPDLGMVLGRHGVVNIGQRTRVAVLCSLRRFGRSVMARNIRSPDARPERLGLGDVLDRLDAEHGDRQRV